MADRDLFREIVSDTRDLLERSAGRRGVVALSPEVAAMLDAITPQASLPETGQDNIEPPVDLEILEKSVSTCTKCPLHETRTKTVFGDGARDADLVFVGEAPGFEEDHQGLPFVGRAGQLLTDIIEKGMGIARAEVSIANIIKCRPPENRDPTSAEKATCSPWLDRQIELLAPRVIIPLGRHAAGHLLASDAPMGQMRGRIHERGGRKIIPTYHPAFLLRSPGMKKTCWTDIQLAMKELDLERPG